MAEDRRKEAEEDRDLFFEKKTPVQKAKAIGKSVAAKAAEKAAGLLELPDRTDQPVYSKISSIPTGTAPKTITPGCLVLEGGAFRGLYTQGVLDAMMEDGINFQTTIGVSAGALSAIGYVAGQIGWAARLNLTYRHNPNYIGVEAMKRDHGITGFSFIFKDVMKEAPIDKKRFMDPARRYIVTATNLNTGRVEYFEKGKCRNILRAAQASATVPYISRPVVMRGVPYLDGSLAENIPYHWAKREGFDRIVVVKTRDRSYRKEPSEPETLNRMMYHKYPNLMAAMEHMDVRYDCLLDEIDADEAWGRTFVIAPGEPVTIGRFEGDMEKLGALYWEGYQDMKKETGRLKSYLGME